MCQVGKIAIIRLNSHQQMLTLIYTSLNFIGHLKKRKRKDIKIKDKAVPVGGWLLFLIWQIPEKDTTKIVINKLFSKVPRL